MNLNRLGHAFGGFGGRDVQASNPTLFRVYGFRVQKFSVYQGFVGRLPPQGRTTTCRVMYRGNVGGYICTMEHKIEITI